MQIQTLQLEGAYMDASSPQRNFYPDTPASAHSYHYSPFSSLQSPTPSTPAATSIPPVTSSSSVALHGIHSLASPIVFPPHQQQQQDRPQSSFPSQYIPSGPSPASSYSTPIHANATLAAPELGELGNGIFSGSTPPGLSSSPHSHASSSVYSPASEASPRAEIASTHPHSESVRSPDTLAKGEDYLPSSRDSFLSESERAAGKESPYLFNQPQNLFQQQQQQQQQHQEQNPSTPSGRSILIPTATTGYPSRFYLTPSLSGGQNALGFQGHDESVNQVTSPSNSLVPVQQTASQLNSSFGKSELPSFNNNSFPDLPANGFQAAYNIYPNQSGSDGKMMITTNAVSYHHGNQPTPTQNLPVFQDAAAYGNADPFNSPQSQPGRPNSIPLIYHTNPTPPPPTQSVQPHSIITDFPEHHDLNSAATPFTGASQYYSPNLNGSVTSYPFTPSHPQYEELAGAGRVTATPMTPIPSATLPYSAPALGAAYVPGYSSTGTFSCTYQGCRLRFTTMKFLQKHKRDGHRRANDRRGGGSGPVKNGGVKKQKAAAFKTYRDAPINENRAETQDGPHYCHLINPQTGKQCNRVFSRPYDLTRHEDAIHNEEKQKIVCQVCREGNIDKTFSRYDALSRHYRVVHPSETIPTRRLAKLKTARTPKLPSEDDKQQPELYTGQQPLAAPESQLPASSPQQQQQPPSFPQVHDSYLWDFAQQPIA